MAAALTLLLIGCLLQSALCAEWAAFMPQSIEVLTGSCVTIPCSFDVPTDFASNLDETCKAEWKTGLDTAVFDNKNPQSRINGALNGDLTRRDCTTTLNNMQPGDSNKYFLRLECNNRLKLNYIRQKLDISVKDDPPKPTLTPSTLQVEDGATVSLTCSAPAPCPSHPPTLTWTPGLGHSQETLQEKEDKTKVQTSVLTFTASYFHHHGKEISCTAVYNKLDDSAVSSVTSITADVSCPWCDQFNATLPQTMEVLSGSCVTIPCSFNVPDNYRSDLDDTCRAVWKNDQNSIVFDGTNPQLSKIQGQLHGDLTKRDCTTTFNNVQLQQRNKFYLRVDCRSHLKYDIKTQKVEISITDDPPTPTLTPSTLQVKEGTSVSLTCSAPAPCLSHPPTLTWTPSLGHSQETLQENEDKTKVQTSVLTFIASRHHHRQEISCTAVYKKLDGSTESSVRKSLTADISYPPKDTTVSVSPSGPVPENSSVTLTCSSTANPAVKSYTWYRADKHQTVMGTGHVLNISISRDSGSFFCKAENDLGDGRSSISQIDVQYPPKDTTVSVSPSGPVPENSSVTVTCSSTANPAVKSYTWYRADKHQTVMGTGHVLNIRASRDSSSFFCKTENDLGDGRSNISQIDVQWAPQILTSSDCTKTADQLSCSCQAVGNPSPTLQWYLDGVPVNDSDRFTISSEPLNDTGLSSIITVGQLLRRDLSTLLCHSSNSLGSATQKFYVIEYHGLEQYLGPYGVPLLAVAAVSLCVNILCTIYVVFLKKARKSMKPKEEEDRIYMSLELRDLSPVYDAIGQTPK